MKIVQILPELNSGGVERGTVEFADWLVTTGHQSVVISNGGSLVDTLVQQGSEHIHFPVHKKSLWSLRHVKPFRQLLLNLNADIVHVRSRLPAWLVKLAIGRLPYGSRPAIVSSFHGLYSTNRYSEVMGCGDQVIAISHCVHNYIVENYPRIDKNKITVIHRGVDQRTFSGDYRASSSWKESFYADYPRLKDKAIVLMPGRLTPWKGQEDFLNIMALLKERNVPCHGVIVGGADPSKVAYEKLLKDKVDALNLGGEVTFLGHRTDIQNIYSMAKVVCNLSTHPEPFGRTVIEALALGVPVAAYNIGGPAESLQACLPEGLAEIGANQQQQIATIVEAFLQQPPSIVFPEEFTLSQQATKTMVVYQRALQQQEQAA